ncbi:hypothetical protein [Paenibacillus abyssi]|uniref:Uncharacterized protein n=2 Tax=Paenibacillus abyssi TaxID=1340531 RepID=A0A917CL80_9BACL|nr:hypothetical protein [Paenibacillus abyssi]GGF92301.1 hypothetical protein GCM10010916_07120 [Paenibacillus abyssi]
MDIEFNDETIKVEDIIRKMKTELSKNNINEDIGNIKLPNHFDESDRHGSVTPELKIALEQLNRSWNNSIEYEISSHRRYIGPMIVLGKRVVRKFLRWYINPITHSQAEFNASVTRAMSAMVKQIELNEKSYSELRNEMKELVRTNEELVKQINKMYIKENR